MQRVDNLIVAIPGLDTWHGREARLFYYTVERDHRPDSTDVWYELHIRVQNVEGPRQGRTHVIRVASPSGQLEMDAGASMTFFAPLRSTNPESSVLRFIEQRQRIHEDQNELTLCAQSFLERISPDLRGPLAGAGLALRHGLRRRYRERIRSTITISPRRLS